MECFGDIFISVNFKKTDYLSLNLNMESDNNCWNRAVEIFHDRIDGRFLSLIKKLIEDRDIKKDGFAIMALDCLLIETLLQFKNGLDSTPYRMNDRYYSSFLHEVVGCPKTLARRFYREIRCGILHSAETKNNSQLTFNQPYTIRIVDENVLSVNVENLTHAILEYYQWYLHQLNNSHERELRLNFIKKMNYICNLGFVI